MSREGDWICPACNHFNFRKRDSCQRCTCPKYATEADLSLYGQHKSEFLPRDWYCGSSNFRAHNYASRTSCHRCGASTDYCGYGAALMIPSASYAQDPSVLPGWKTGDWICSRKRDSCQRCTCPKYATEADLSLYGLHKSEVLPGDWYCGRSNCGAHNYASRTSCHRCGASKDYCGYGAELMIPSASYAQDPSVLPGWKTGDWICSRCGMHNYASRVECFKCKSPTDFGGAM